MTELPDYVSRQPPSDTPLEEYDYHDRRAEICDLWIQQGGPGALVQTRLADRYDVADSTITRDKKRIRESLAAHTGEDFKATATIVYEYFRREMRQADDWRAKKALADKTLDFGRWFMETGDIHREPDRIEGDFRHRSSEVQYRVVREEPAALPTDDADGVDFEALGFAEGPAGVDVDAVDELEGRDE